MAQLDQHYQNWKPEPHCTLTCTLHALNTAQSTIRGTWRYEDGAISSHSLLSDNCWLFVCCWALIPSPNYLGHFKSYTLHDQQYVALEDMKMELSWAILHTTRAHSSHNWGQQGPAKAATTKKMWTNWKIAWSEKHWNTSKYNLNRWISHKVHQ